MKRLLWIVILLGIALVIATVGLHGWWLYSAPVAEHRSIVWPGGTASSASHTIRVELAQDLAATGATCGFQGAGEEVDQILFLRTEKALVQVKLTAAAKPLDGCTSRVAVALLPAGMINDQGFTVTAKSGLGIWMV